MDGHRFLNKSLKNVADRRGYVLVVARGDDKTLVVGTDNAVNRLIMINGASPLGHVVRAYRTDHYKRITENLARTYGAIASDCFGDWYQARADRMHAVIKLYDMRTGASALEIHADALERLGPLAQRALANLDRLKRLCSETERGAPT